MKPFLDKRAARGSERLQKSAGTQRQPHGHCDRIPASTVHSAHALESDRPGGPTKPHFHRPFLKIARSSDQFLCTTHNSLGTAVDQQDRIASRKFTNIRSLQISRAHSYNFLVTISYNSEFITWL